MACAKALRLGRTEMRESRVRSGVSPPKPRGPTSVAEKAGKAGQDQATNGLLPHAKESGCLRSTEEFYARSRHKNSQDGDKGHQRWLGSLVTCGY